MRAAARPRHDADLRQAARPLFQNQIVFEQIEIAQVNIVAVGNDFAPILASRLRHRRRHQAKVLRLIVGADEEAVGDMIDLILMAARSRQKHFECADQDSRHRDNDTRG